jgi:hypothetical protein
MSLEEDCRGLEVTPNMKFLVTFGTNKKSYFKFITNMKEAGCDQKFCEKSPSKLVVRMF